MIQLTRNFLPFSKNGSIVYFEPTDSNNLENQWIENNLSPKIDFYKKNKIRTILFFGYRTADNYWEETKKEFEKNKFKINNIHFPKFPNLNNKNSRDEYLDYALKIESFHKTYDKKKFIVYFPKESLDEVLYFFLSGVLWENIEISPKELLEFVLDEEKNKDFFLEFTNQIKSYHNFLSGEFYLIFKSLKFKPEEKISFTKNEIYSSFSFSKENDSLKNIKVPLDTFDGVKEVELNLSSLFEKSEDSNLPNSNDQENINFNTDSLIEKEFIPEFQVDISDTNTYLNIVQSDLEEDLIDEDLPIESKNNNAISNPNTDPILKNTQNGLNSLLEKENIVNQNPNDNTNSPVKNKSSLDKENISIKNQPIESEDDIIDLNFPSEDEDEIYYKSKSNDPIEIKEKHLYLDIDSTNEVKINDPNAQVDKSSSLDLDETNYLFNSNSSNESPQNLNKDQPKEKEEEIIDLNLTSEVEEEISVDNKSIDDEASKPNSNFISPIPEPKIDPNFEIMDLISPKPRSFLKIEILEKDPIDLNDFIKNDSKKFSIESTDESIETNEEIKEPSSNESITKVEDESSKKLVDDLMQMADKIDPDSYLFQDDESEIEKIFPDTATNLESIEDDNVENLSFESDLKFISENNEDISIESIKETVVKEDVQTTETQEENQIPSIKDVPFPEVLDIDNLIIDELENETDYMTPTILENEILDNTNESISSVDTFHRNEAYHTESDINAIDANDTNLTKK
jgi:hypothetical protein